MNRTEIVEALAREKRVEQMVQSIAHQSMSANLKDLSQMVYMILLQYDEEKLIDLWENEQINFFLARVIVKQYRSNNSPFYALFRRYEKRIDESASLTDYEDGL